MIVSDLREKLSESCTNTCRVHVKLHVKLLQMKLQGMVQRVSGQRTHFREKCLLRVISDIISTKKSRPVESLNSNCISSRMCDVFKIKHSTTLWLFGKGNQKLGVRKPVTVLFPLFGRLEWIEICHISLKKRYVFVLSLSHIATQVEDHREVKLRLKKWFIDITGYLM